MILYVIPDSCPNASILWDSNVFPDKVREDVMHWLFGKAIKKTRKIRGAVVMTWTCAGCTCDCTSRKCRMGGYPL